MNSRSVGYRLPFYQGCVQRNSIAAAPGARSRAMSIRISPRTSVLIRQGARWFSGTQLTTGMPRSGPAPRPPSLTLPAMLGHTCELVHTCVLRKYNTRLAIEVWRSSRVNLVAIHADGTDY
jgi:hypothetical protein